MANELKICRADLLRAAIRKAAKCIFGSLKTVNGHNLVGNGNIALSPRGAAAIEISEVEIISGSVSSFNDGCTYTPVYDTASSTMCLRVFSKSNRTSSYVAAWPGMDAVCDSERIPWPDVVYVSSGKLWLWDGSALVAVPAVSSGDGAGSGVVLNQFGGLAFDPSTGGLYVCRDDSTIKVSRTNGSLYVDFSSIGMASLEASGLMSAEDKTTLGILAEALPQLVSRTDFDAFRSQVSGTLNSISRWSTGADSKISALHSMHSVSIGEVVNLETTWTGADYSDFKAGDFLSMTDASGSSHHCIIETSSTNFIRYVGLGADPVYGRLFKDGTATAVGLTK